MAARRCSTCGINYPLQRAIGCAVCRGQLSLMDDESPHVDWNERAQALQATAEAEERAVYSWRYEELERAGYDQEHARAIAGRVDIDLHQAVTLLERGCPRLLAAKILL